MTAGKKLEPANRKAGGKLAEFNDGSTSRENQAREGSLPQFAPPRARDGHRHCKCSEMENKDMFL
jgi:hypothetical protein